MSRSDVTVLITIGERAELLTPTRGAGSPLCVQAADITADTGIPVDELAGKRLTAIITETLENGMTARDYRVAAAG
jgi:hypothetical protein